MGPCKVGGDRAGCRYRNQWTCLFVYTLLLAISATRCAAVGATKRKRSVPSWVKAAKLEAAEEWWWENEKAKTKTKDDRRKTQETGPVGDWSSSKISPEEAFERSGKEDQKQPPKKRTRNHTTGGGAADQHEQYHQRQSRRRTSWWNGYSGTDPYNDPIYTNIGTEEDPYAGYSYDEWAMGWRILGGYVDCTMKMDYEDDRRKLNDDGDGGCERWILWAAYYNPYYKGNEYYDYVEYDDDGHEAYRQENLYDDVYKGSHQSQLDCHDDSSAWELVGVYRIDIGTFLEQLTKHVWAYNDWQYTAVYSASNYIGDGDCEQIGQGNDGTYLYGALRPIEGGYFMMGVYLDQDCLLATNDYTYDDVAGSYYADYNANGQNKYQYVDDDYVGNQMSAWKINAKEDTLEMFNDALEDFRSCSPCVDYPSYQDGYEDDGINQCYKFYSHGGYNCRGECLKIAAKQGTITNIRYGTYEFKGSGKALSYSSKNKQTVTAFQRVLSNFFLSVSAIIFVATFLSFYTTRGAYSRDVGSLKGASMMAELNDEANDASTGMKNRLRPLDLYDRFFRRTNPGANQRGSNLNRQVSEASGQSTDYSGERMGHEETSDDSDNTNAEETEDWHKENLGRRSGERPIIDRGRSSQHVRRRSASPVRARSMSARRSSPVRIPASRSRSPSKRNPRAQYTESDLRFNRDSSSNSRKKRYDEEGTSDSEDYEPAAKVYRNKSERLQSLRQDWK